jgi:hypothetical protein
MNCWRCLLLCGPFCIKKRLCGVVFAAPYSYKAIAQDCCRLHFLRGPRRINGKQTITFSQNLSSYFNCIAFLLAGGSPIKQCRISDLNYLVSICHGLLRVGTGGHGSIARWRKWSAVPSIYAECSSGDICPQPQCRSPTLRRN